MQTEKLASDSEPDRCYRVFFDGESLAMTFPSQPDYDYFTKLIIYHIKQAETGSVRRVLIDCFLLSEIDVSRLAHFLSLGQGLQRLGIELLLLDAPADLSNYMEPLLPQANWMHSVTGRASAHASSGRASTGR
tara:strand:+ start:21584 stop:21982 length:399 start_codon:yes stop_codon:yes gene_type:complete